MPAVAESSQGRAWIGVCNYCAKFVLAVPTGPPYYDPVIYPTPQPEPTDERVYDVSRHALDEARRCFTVEAYNACAAMARRAIQAAVLQKGAPDRRLVEQIDLLADQGLITRDLAAWAHEVRFIGNDGAHPPDNATEEEAKDAMDLAEQFLTVLYVAPAIAEARRKAREQAKAKK